MTNFTATVPIANMAAVNSALEAQGFGPGNFSIPVYGATGVTHATLHCWPDAAFQAALEAIPQVTVTLPGSESSDPAALVDKAATAVSGVRAENLPLLPDKGAVAAKKLYRFESETEGTKVFYVDKAFSRDTYNLDPATYPTVLSKVEDTTKLSIDKPVLEEIAEVIK